MATGEWVFPKIITGTVYEVDGTTIIPSTKVYLHNTTTNVLLGSVLTDANGKYIFDLQTYSSSWTTGDTFKVVAGRLISRCVISDLITEDTYDYKFTITIEFTNNTVGNALITDAGLNVVRDWFMGSSAVVPKGVGWGTGTTTPASTDTYLEYEQERNIFDGQSRQYNSVTYETTLETSEANSVDITKTGIYSQGTGGGSTTVTINTSAGGATANITVD